MGEINNTNIGIIILAAGASTRLGRPKQLLEFENQTLLEKIAKNALETNLRTIVVLGANSEVIEKSIKYLPIEIVFNENWQSGMSSSIVTGLRNLLKTKKDLSAVIILLCDQPFVTTEIILQLIKTQKNTNKNIVASEYENTIGVPALFTEKVFDDLLNLNEEIGAKSIIKKYSRTDLAKVTVPEASFDIDTEEDLTRFRKTIGGV